MDNKIVKFDERELEMAIVTYNRQEFIEEWLKCCYEQAKKRNIHLSIYDSSTNNETERYIKAFKTETNDKDIEYYHVDSNIPIGYKPMLPLLSSKSKYVWVVGDSRCYDFNCLDEKVFPYLKQNMDCVVLHIIKNEENDGKIYTDREEFFRDCYDSIGVVGLVIYKTSMFEPLKNNQQLRNECDQKYENNCGLAWMGYFLDMFAMKEYRAVFTVVPIINIKADKKIISWIDKYYSSWIENSCGLMDGLSDKYQCTDQVLRDAWKYSAQNIPINYYTMRKYGDLNKETFRKYKDNGMLERCTRHTERMGRFANASDEELDLVLEQEKEIELRDFKELCYQNIRNIENLSKGRELWIYGAGNGGKILAKCLLEYNIPFCGFLDKYADSVKICEGMPVKMIHEINSKNCFIAISLLFWRPFIVSSLLKAGIKRNHILYLSIECD